MMAIVLAIDATHVQRQLLGLVTEEVAGHGAMVAARHREPLEVLERLVPGLTLFPIFVSSADEAALMSCIRRLSGTEESQPSSGVDQKWGRVHRPHLFSY
jgi:hypothetical protein